MSNKTQLVLVDLTSIKEIEYEVITYITFKSKEEINVFQIPYYKIHDEYCYEGRFYKPLGEDFIKKFKQLCEDKIIYNINITKVGGDIIYKDPDDNIEKIISK